MTTAAPRRTTYAVWEITLKCNLACSHCGSRAGDARPDELSTAEALNLVGQLRDAGIDEVTLIGGEAYLRKDWLDIAREIVAQGMLCGMTTGGLALSPNMAKKMKDVGFCSVSVSIDGLEATHDGLRGVPGSWAGAFRALEALRAEGVPAACNTQINRRSWKELPALYELIRDAGIHSWQIQLTVPMGNAADQAELLLQPYELLELYPMLGELAARAHAEGVTMHPGNNIGYYGPYDQLLMGRNDNKPVYYSGCEAGSRTLGIEADGKIKGCPSLPSKPYTGANIRDLSLIEIMANTEPLQFNLIPRFTEESTAHMWGFCGTCRYKQLCRGGCSWTAHVFFDKRGNNPYCHFRALELAAQGLRERVYIVQAAPGTPFDNGLFAAAIEPLDAPLPATPWVTPGVDVAVPADRGAYQPGR
ncbi:MAG: nif11-class peptide radical maturase 3 [Cyanobacteria bacterium RYN_339]|nr:nif11-class peptide radical maturase 3 [Cyanobacteria bacterium RYN_339]